MIQELSRTVLPLLVMLEVGQELHCLVQVQEVELHQLALAPEPEQKLHCVQPEQKLHLLVHQQT